MTISDDIERVASSSLIRCKFGSMEAAVKVRTLEITFKKFSFRGVDLDALLDMSTDELVKLFSARALKRFQRGLKRKPMALIKKLCKVKKEGPIWREARTYFLTVLGYAIHHPLLSFFTISISKQHPLLWTIAGIAPLCVWVY
ncbi:uncharacterized protein LOC111284232 [Durio zibethinus]|uniref:Uncharacterized protein LOC111284232 n=1 Tax=Durio zibethinus TaxID=66656 RepID=A0A6P5XKH0_DURZI|nr:uncharacterized protein LOC111284232 [Durio zibethinus]